MSVKICGVVNTKQIITLDRMGVDYAGIWFGIPEGKHNLRESDIRSLSEHRNTQIKPVLVTLLDDIKHLEPVVSGGYFHAIQLHGFSLPARIEKLKNSDTPAFKVFKVLHVKNGQCLEESFIDRYIDAGVDAFILDSFEDARNIGSTGVAIDGTFLDSFFSRYPVEGKTMIAGGISSRNIASVYENYDVLGVDIDSAARVKGEISCQRVREIMNAKNAHKDAFTY